MRTRSCWLTGLLVALAGSGFDASVAHAQTARPGGGGSGSAAAMQQLQQLASERTQLQAENARLKKELQDLRKQGDGAKSAQQSLAVRARNAEAQLGRSAAERDRASQDLERERTRLRELVEKSREIVDTLRTVETARAVDQRELATRDQQLKACVGRNVALYDLNAETLDQLEREAGASIEPFTRLKRVRLGNLVEEYRHRAEDNLLPSATPRDPAQ